MEELQMLRGTLNTNLVRMMEVEDRTEDDELDPLSMARGYVEACGVRDTIALALYHGQAHSLK